MRRSSEPRERKYVEGCSFLPFAGKFGDKYGKKLMDAAKKTGIDAAKPAPKRRDLIANKIADKITSTGKT